MRSGAIICQRSGLEGYGGSLDRICVIRYHYKKTPARINLGGRAYERSNFYLKLTFKLLHFLIDKGVHHKGKGYIFPRHGYFGYLVVFS